MFNSMSKLHLKVSLKARFINSRYYVYIGILSSYKSENQTKTKKLSHQGIYFKTNQQIQPYEDEPNRYI